MKKEDISKEGQVDALNFEMMTMRQLIALAYNKYMFSADIFSGPF